MTVAATRPETDERPESSTVEMLDKRRRDVTEALTERTGKDLSDLMEHEFREGVRRVKLVQARMAELLGEVLIEDAHFGNPKDSSGKPAFKKPILYKAGAEELRRLMRLTLRRTAADEIVAQEDYVAVIVSIGVFDGVGRLLATRRASCTTKEKRFKRFDGKGWTYDDAREKLHDCIAMAEKRAGSLLTCEVSGATAFFANAETMEDALEDDKPVTPWTQDEKKRVYESASKKRMNRREIADLVHATLGRAAVGSGDEVDLLLAAIATWDRAPKAGAAGAPASDIPGQQSAPAAPPPPAPAPAAERGQVEADLALDRKIAAER